MPKVIRTTGFVGIVNGRVHFYRDAQYYKATRHADLFRNKKAAKNCYEDVRRATLIVSGKRV